VAKRKAKPGGLRAYGRTLIVQKLPAPKRIGAVHLPQGADLSRLIECRATVLSVGSRVREQVAAGDVVLLDPKGTGWPHDEFAREDGLMTVDVDTVLGVYE
jgi:hypothetical protein